MGCCPVLSFVLCWLRVGLRGLGGVCVMFVGGFFCLCRLGLC